MLLWQCFTPTTAQFQHPGQRLQQVAHKDAEARSSLRTTAESVTFLPST
jgi:hypothetical protein